jgi:glycosyltransferase involved in cell wall biosynthesis
VKKDLKKICIVATVTYPLLVFMKPHIAMLSDQYDVTLIANGAESELVALLNENVRFIPVGIERKISLWRDVKALFKLYGIFRKERFDVVHSIMPKSALLGMLAAFCARVPHRLHMFTGQVWATKTGFSRWALKMLDKLIAKSATHLLADSFSQRQFLINEHVVNENKIKVLGKGSICGVDIQRFQPNPKAREQIRRDLNIPADAIVYLFLGRLNKDKGVQDLANAFVGLAAKMPSIHLLIVGPDEEGMDEKLGVILHKVLSQYHRVGFTARPEDYMACADIFCLPSYREGFGSVIIEASATGLPAIASNIYGLVDAVSNNETGLLHPPRDIEEIQKLLLRLSESHALRERMGAAGMTRARQYFSSELVTEQMKAYYQYFLVKN